MLGKQAILCQTNYSQGHLLASDIFEVAKWLCFSLENSILYPSTPGDFLSLPSQCDKVVGQTAVT